MVEVVRSPSIATDLGMTNCKLITWSALDSDDSGQAVFVPMYSDKCVQIGGTFGSGGSVTIYGSNDLDAVRTDLANGTLFGSATAEWVALTDAQGNALTKTAAAIEQILENPAYICPVVTAGDGTTSIEVMLLCKLTEVR